MRMLIDVSWKELEAPEKEIQKIVGANKFL